MRVVRVVNFVSPTSGGIRQVIRQLSAAQADFGVSSHVLAPGPEPGLAVGNGIDGIHLVPSVRIHPSQSYRVTLARRHIRSLVQALRPDVVEVHDQTTLAWLGQECAQQGIRTVLVAHERLDALAGFWAKSTLARRGARSHLKSVARGFHAVVAPSRFAAAPFVAQDEDRAPEPVATSRDGATSARVQVVPWGVDHQVFSHGARTTGGETLRLMHCGRLSPEKDPIVSADATLRLHRAGVPVSLTMIGAGPEFERVRERLADVPHRMLGHVDDPATIAEELRRADVFLAPGPFETFGIGALEAQACGVPVVCRHSGAVGELDATTPAAPADFAVAARSLWRDPQASARSVAAAAERTWAKAGSALLEMYQP